MTTPTVDELLDLAQDYRQRLRVAVGQPKSAVRRPAPWYEIRNQVDDAAMADETDIYLYDVIGGWCGITAQDFVAALQMVESSVINVHINSPGGDVFDGIAIFQALRNHPARIVTYVDSLAASAASFIAMAGDKRVIAPYGSLMIHDAWGMCVGNAVEMAKMTDELDRLSNIIASIYADRGTGGDKGEWRDAMHAETWYSAVEAVEAGLMHEQQADAEKGDAGAPGETNASNRWDLSVFNYAGRDKAPAPRFPAGLARAQATASNRQVHPTPAGPAPQLSGAEPEPTTEPEGDDVSTDLSDISSRLGLTDDADKVAIVAAIDELKAQADNPPTDPEREAQVLAQAEENTELRKVVDMLSNRMEAVTAELAETKAEKAAATKKSVIDAAQNAGKFTLDERAQWEADYDEAPAAVTRMLDRIATGSAVPVTAAGETGPAEPNGATNWAAWDAEMAHLDGPVSTKGN